MDSLVHNQDLRRHNSFGFAACAANFMRVETLEQLQGAVAQARHNSWPVLVLGGGSNLVLREQIPGLVIQMAIGGRRVESVSEDKVRVTLGAGEIWHQSLEWMLEQGYYGLENLALIPGTVGAAPIQNIGAYGVELEQRFDSLLALDTDSGDLRRFNRDDCRFGYRDSCFKSHEPGRYVILEVSFALSLIPNLVLRYQALADELKARGIEQPQPSDVFDVVCAIRQQKLPDPAELGNAGSFFKNPLVSADRYRDLLQQFPNLVAYPADDAYKLAAGWLIEQCGWKGRCIGAVGVYSRQALVLVNQGSGTATELMLLAGQVVDSVQLRFGVVLEMEPRLYPA
ncbi:UDP-N-acetylmuramate dehydrogenase [Marinobacterium sedimentorum]|uniref:UDP-N-acetylmuramate dehydrogenase n=1 Tax=Marinobacterium sedimentorum TaxID=2927804 RepID=UPI0020C6C45D|nr:UDP-N-acetylmuramate dehydrogenase [Marinobacterium sedimentorum]MCP8687391.1 UDP-N-acetylmuramate dehydrogenase [Marinobacterium sedimentorum]